MWGPRLAGASAIGLFVASLGLSGIFRPHAAIALPVYARQTNQPCTACHVGGFGPQLTPYGRAFKLGGYSEGHPIVPLSAMAVASFTHTAKDASEPYSGHDGVNDNVAVPEVSGFLAGRIAPHLGSFIQGTYSETDRSASLDEVDVRYAQPLKLAGKDLLVGLDFNNNPTVQDPFNTLYAWSFPYESPELSPQRAAAPFLYGGIEHQAAGVSTYLWFDDSLYAELGGYRSFSHGFLNTFNIADEAGRISGVAPYWRLAYQKNFGKSTGSIGLVGTHAAIHPDRLGGPTNRYTDWGVDATYQYLGNRKNIYSFNGAFIHERQKLDYSVSNGDSALSRHTLDSFNADLSWYHNQSYGLTGGVFHVTGTRDPALYAPEADNGSRTGKPDNDGYILQADWTPFGKEDSAVTWVNLRLGLQYTGYTKFNGARHDYDGFGRNASDNNTLFAFAWLAW